MAQVAQVNAVLLPALFEWFPYPGVASLSIKGV